MYKSIQGCRAVAALLVVLYHLGVALSSPKYFGASVLRLPFVWGDAGVEFFFVLSGFIITWAHFCEIGRPSSLPTYVRKRFTRIFPSYWIVFGIVFLTVAASSASRSTLPLDLSTLVKSLALLPQDKNLVGGTGSPVLIVAWSLQYEVCFYVLFAMFIVNRFVGIALTIILLLNCASCHEHLCRFPQSFFADNWFFLFGLGAIVTFAVKRTTPVRHALLVALMAGGAFLSYGAIEAVFGTDFFPVDRRLVYGAVSAVLIFSLICAESSGELRVRSRWLSLLGDSSYALYLIHYPLISLLCKFLVLIGLSGNVGAYIAYPSILLITVLSAITFHLFVEKPILALLAPNKTSNAVPALLS
jgi:peptidoglycan/LPS O-acetylase OafA/YrhL